MSAGDQAGPSVAGRVARRRVVVEPAGFAAVDRRGVDARFVVVRRVAGFVGAFVVAAFAVVAFGVAAFRVDAVGVVIAGAATLAAATGALAEERGFDVEAARLRAPAAGLAPARRRVDAAVGRVVVPVWRPRIPPMRADSSAISSRTSASRWLRLSRLFFVAFSSRPARQVSSERAAARANSSHSMWRASAAAGVMTAVLASVMSSPDSKFRVHSRP
jgi:hypothetical protein